MRAALLHGPRDLRVESVEAFAPGPGEVVLDVRAALTCGTDTKTFLRGHPSIGTYPARFGHEFAGVVAEAGPGVVAVRPGDEVFCGNSAPCFHCFYCEQRRYGLCRDLTYLLGGFGQQVTVPEPVARANLHHLPPGLPMALAPMAEPLACVLRGVELAHVEAGETVVIIGAGSMGLMLTAAVASLGAVAIVADPHRDRLRLAEAFGAKHTVVARRDNRDVAAVRALTRDGRGPDQAFEAVGRPRSWQLALGMVRPGGAVNLFGGCAPNTEIAMSAARIHYEEVTLRGMYHHSPAHLAAALERLTEAESPWALLCGPTIGLGDLAAALAGEMHASGLKFQVDPWA